MQVIFSATADPFFGAASGSASSYTKISNEASESETATVEAAYREFIFEDMSKAPISFNVGGKAYTGFDLSGDFVKVSQQTEVNELYGGREETTTVLTHTPSGLTFELLSTYYPGYAGYDLTLYIKNETENVSPVVKDLKIVDMRLSGDDAFLYYTGRRPGQVQSVRQVPGRAEPRTAPSGGRSSNGVFPYFNLEYGGGGVLFAVGWPGQWQAGFDNTARSSTRLTMGQQNFESVLEPARRRARPLPRLFSTRAETPTVRRTSGGAGFWTASSPKSRTARTAISCSTRSLRAARQTSGRRRRARPTTIRSRLWTYTWTTA